MTQDDFIKIWDKIEYNVEIVARYSVGLGINYHIDDLMMETEKLKNILKLNQIPEDLQKEIIDYPVEFYCNFMEHYKPSKFSYYRSLFIKSPSIQKSIKELILK